MAHILVRYPEEAQPHRCYNEYAHGRTLSLSWAELSSYLIR